MVIVKIDSACVWTMAIIINLFGHKMLPHKMIFSKNVLPLMYHHVCIEHIDCSETKENDKWPFYGHFRPFFGQLCYYISQNWGSDGHFEVLNRSKPWLIEKLWLKMQIFPFSFFCDIVEKNAFVFVAILGFIYVLCYKCCTNHDSDLFSTSKWPSEPPFCERFSYSWHKNGQKWS